ncbi:MAG: DEAD/DEAH box helicase [Spirochaetes bacterium]|nr:MAG: DEAD/DEAH box helicase [Spirochaetota bacterium]
MKPYLKRKPNLIPKMHGFDYQLEAVRAIQKLEYSAIFHEQGLGKTKIAIDLLLYWLESQIIDTVMIVVKKSLLHNWHEELKQHCQLRPGILSQDKHQNHFVFNGDFRIVLTNYEVVKSEFERMILFLKSRDVGAILDESVKIKNPDSSLTQAFFNLAPFFKRRVIMTGTPVANRPYDIWAQIWFLDQGRSLGNNYQHFRHSHDLSNNLAESTELRTSLENGLLEIMNNISHFTVRETKSSGVISLPEKVFERVESIWEPIQYEMYSQVRDEMRTTIIKEGLAFDDISEGILKRLLRLVQITSNPRLVDESYCSEPGKLIYLHDLIHRITDNKEKCIVWTSFTENVDWLSRDLVEFGTCKIYGKMNMYERSHSVAAFKNDPKTRILIATPGAAKEGLTLTVANHVIFYDRGFSLDDYIQAQDRIHRISQQHTCFVHNIVMQDSIDEWIDALLTSKELAAKLAQGDITLEYYRSRMSYDFGTMLKDILKIPSKGNVNE